MKIEKFWIETCHEKSSYDQNVLTHSIHVLITRAELRDDHPHLSNITITDSTSSSATSLTTKAATPISAHLLDPSADKDVASIDSQ